MDSVVASMSNRDRSVLGADCQQKARRALLSLLTGREAEPYFDSSHQNILIMGPNATSLLEDLAQRCYEGMLKEGDEIVIASENHLANVLPWIALAKKVGAQVKWWTVTDTKKDVWNNSALQHVTESSVLSELVTSKTKLVAVSHASNILGCVRLIPSICRLVHHKTKNRGQVVVDGVAAAPHMLSLDLFQMTDPSVHPDFYVVSLHKMFGPHIGCLIAKKSSFLKLLNCPSASDAALYKLLERGTMNYEACAGACALKKYFQIIANESMKLMTIGSEVILNEKGLTRECRSMHQTVDSLESLSGSPLHENTNCDVPLMQTAKNAIQNLETRLVNRLLHRLQQSSPLVRII
jgi:selenocysteine lyase/cysteine desulfurase